MDNDYPVWVCVPCGVKFGKNVQETRISTFHIGVCDVCGKEDAVTEPRDFGYLKDNWRDAKKGK